MKKAVFKIALLLLLIISSCKEESSILSKDGFDDLTVKPVVTKSGNNYSESTFANRFPDQTLLNDMSEAYNTNYSKELRLLMIESMKHDVINLGLDIEVFEKCLSAADIIETDLVSLPCLAEYAEFNNEKVWIIQQVWGMNPEDLGHFKCFAISAIDQDTLHFVQCR